MQIFNVRLGFATNSSSKHSFIFLPQGVVAEDFGGVYYQEGDEFRPERREVLPIGDFGWEHFTAASPDTKKTYLAVLLQQQLFRKLPIRIVDLILDHWIGTVPNTDSSIDHQSVYELPCEYNSTIPSEDFIRDFLSFLMQERLVILGGNDNEDRVHPLDDGSSFVLPIPRDEYGHSFTCRKDPLYNYWTLFNVKNGAKVRFRFADSRAGLTDIPKKAFAPELVDIKITSECGKGCPYCYQDAEPKGRHSDQMWNISRALGELEVFEVALGGGEPMHHPQLLEILGYLRRDGIVPHFTTRDLQWLRDAKKWGPIMELVGAIGFSVDGNDYEKIKDLASLCNHNNIPPERFTIHLAMGTIHDWHFSHLLKECLHHDFNVLLLGFKKVGRAKKYNVIPYPWWLEKVKEIRESIGGGDNGIAIDTVLAQEYEQEILAANVPRWLFSTKEGDFSCYIDALKMKIGPSSYCSPKQMKPLKEDPQTDMAEIIKNQFATF